MIYISLGSNLGDRLGYIHKALNLIKQRCFSNLKCSLILETKAIVPKSAPKEWDIPYLNAICCGESNISPQDLLRQLKQIELDLGRDEAYERWAPRVIDLDILLWDGVEMESELLSIPHRQLLNRPFLLHLLSMLNPSMKLHDQTVGTFAQQKQCNFINSIAPMPYLIGIVNITHDSFSDGGLYASASVAVEHALTLQAEGASIVELGAQSTRPGADLIEPAVEYERLSSVLSQLKSEMSISIDSCTSPVIIELLKNYSIDYINDVSGNLPDEALKAIISANCKLVFMHSLSIPASKAILMDHDKDIIKPIISSMENRINHLLDLGFKADSLIFDPGIGFGKSSYQSLEILRQVQEFKENGIKILIGHSRKSYIASFSNKAAADRDLETIAASSWLYQQGVQYLRVHDIRQHQRYFTSLAAITGGCYI
jgi:2-amino-4-hydroxy-6-hydroxymethyldihydropteridine diphosphokinase/dihydropteroate synthase